MKLSEKLLWIFLAVPYIYVGIIWNDLPQRLPMHFGADGRPNRIGDKTELIYVLPIMTAVTLFSYYMTAYAYKIDPKKNASMNKEKMKKLALAFAFFTLSIMSFVIYSITKGSASLKLNFLFAGIGVLYAIIGNYMHTLKPNYFAGIRIPWTLNDPENWRKTHLLAGKCWFWGGLLLALLCLFTTPKLARILLLGITAVLCIVPSLYSYLLFRRHDQIK